MQLTGLEFVRGIGDAALSAKSSPEASEARVASIAMLAIRDWRRVQPYANDYVYFDKLLVLHPYVVHGANSRSYDKWYVYDKLRATFEGAIQQVSDPAAVLGIDKSGIGVGVVYSGMAAPLMEGTSVALESAVIIGIDGILCVFYPDSETYWIIEDAMYSRSGS